LNPLPSGFQPPDAAVGAMREFNFKINKIIYENQINGLHDIPNDQHRIILTQNSNV
jgi:hypothetical protein